MAELNKANFIDRYNNSGTGLFRAGQSRGIGSDDTRDLVQYLADSFLNSVTDQLETLSINTTNPTITLFFQDCRDRIFFGASSFATAKTIDFDSATNALRFSFIFEITNVAAVLTFPSSVVMSDARWDNTAKAWTSVDIGKFKADAVFDGTNWYIEISKYPFGSSNIPNEVYISDFVGF